MAATNQRKPISAVLLLLSLLTLPLLPKPVTVDQAKKVADTFLKTANIEKIKADSSKILMLLWN